MEKLDNGFRELQEYQIDPKYVREKLTEVYDRYRQNNIRIDEIKEIMGDNWRDCEEKVQDMFAHNFGLNGIKI